MAGRFDVAVVMPSVLRPTLEQAVLSVFAQAGAGRIQLLVGLDDVQGERAMLEGLAGRAPGHVALQVFDPGDSTSVRHGGLHGATDCGALRTVLSYLADAPLIAYLDDDNWWAPDHLASLGDAITGHDWAFSLRHFVHATSGAVLARDEWESLGPGRGIYQARFGGFVDPNCLMIEARRCEPVLRLWSLPHPSSPEGRAADRNVFAALARDHDWGESGRPSVYYRLNPGDSAHGRRLAAIAGRREPGFDGFRLFADGDFAGAAAAFDGLIALDRASLDGLLWRYVARARSGEMAPALDQLSAALEGGNPSARAMLDLMSGGRDPAGVLSAMQNDPAGLTAQMRRIAFFVGQAALLAGDTGNAARFLALAAEGPAEQAETVAAKAELARLSPG